MGRLIREGCLIRSLIAPYPFEGPIFIIAPPRSGSTFLFECLRRFKEATSLPREADHVWWTFFPYERSHPPTDRVPTEELSDEVPSRLRELHYLRAVNSESVCQRKSRTLWRRLGLQPIRYIDKTIANCLRVDTVKSAFPDANFIFLVRDPRANISSMIEGWSHFPKPQLDPIIQSTRDATIECWTYPAPPGWTSVIDQELPEICAWSWKQHVEHALSAFEETSPVRWVRYERLRENPSKVIEELAEILNMTVNDCVREFLQENPSSRTTISEPEKEKWRRKNEEEVLSVIGKVKDTSQKIGYEV